MSVRRRSTAIVVLLALPSGVLLGLGIPSVCQAGELTKLVARDAAADSRFGTSVAIEGNLAVIGARWDDGGGENAGAVYLFRRSGSEWTDGVKLTASDASEFSRFGQSVSVSRDTIVVGAPRTDDVGTDSGAAYVFRFVENEWIQEDKLTASDAAAVDRFGTSVSIHEDVLVVGSRFDDDECPAEPACNSGSVYVFRRVEAAWTQEAKLTASDASSGAEFGSAVSLDGHLLVIGSYLDDAACAQDPSCDSGSAYVFLFDGISWNEDAKLTASDAEAEDWFGVSVAVEGDVIIVGAEHDSDSGSYSGSAYIFHQPDGGWENMTETAKLTASDGREADRFGVSVFIHGGVALVGARNEDSRGSNAGAVYVYRQNGLHWAEQTKLTASDGELGDRFGVAVAGDGDDALVGAPQENAACPGFPDCNSGAAYVFDVSFGEFDLRDCARLQRCFTGWNPKGSAPVVECLFDFDVDEDVDVDDWRTFTEYFVGP